MYKEGFVGVSLIWAKVFDHGGEISFTGAAFKAILSFFFLRVERNNIECAANSR